MSSGIYGEDGWHGTGGAELEEERESAGLEGSARWWRIRLLFACRYLKLRPQIVRLSRPCVVAMLVREASARLLTYRKCYARHAPLRIVTRDL